MIKSMTNSKIEVWHANYINDPGIRQDVDKNAVIVQIEHSNVHDYIVEVVDKNDIGGEGFGREFERSIF